MGVRRRRKEEKPASAGMFQDLMAENVRDVVALYGGLWEKRYSGRPVVTGRERSKLADLLSQVRDLCAVKGALRHYFQDDAPEKAGHSVAWFIGTYNEHAAASAGGGRRGSKAKACKERGEFEDEVRRYKEGSDAEKGKRPRADRPRGKIRRRRR